MKYNIGDKVKCTSTEGNNFSYGKIYTITKESDNYVYAKDDKGDSNGWDESNFQKLDNEWEVEEDEPEPEVDTGEWGEPIPTEEPIPEELRDLEVKEEIRAMIASFPILLEGAVGTGKTTIAIEIASELNLELVSDTMTRQMTVNQLMGYKNVNGDYIRSNFRDAYEYGKFYLLEEINGGDPNVLLCLNTLENGFLSFADGIVKPHPDFRFMATMNDITNAKDFSGRSILDLSTRDRFHIITVHTKYEDRFPSDVVDLRNYCAEIRTGAGDSYEPSPRDMSRFMELRKTMSPEKAVQKTLLKGFIMNDRELREVINKARDWR